MDGLMSEAADFILSARKNLSLGPDKVLKWESSDTPEPQCDLSSITLLRRSITSSIRNRSIESEVDNSNVSKSSKSSKRFKESHTQRTKVKSRHLLNSELSTINYDTSAAGESERNQSNLTVKAFCELLKDKDGAEEDSLCSADTKSIKSGPPETNEPDEEQKDRNKTVQNGMKLASRNFSDGIFENCSTYNLACDETHQEKMAATSPEMIDSPIASKFLEKNQCDANPGGTALQRSISSADDGMNLRDSFFVDLTSGDEVQNSNPRLDNFIQSEKSSRCSLLAENGTAFPEETSEVQQRCERRLSKKLRKRNRKSKSSNVPIYECPKCGVSYILSAKASERTARCLHCDFWTTVEPEFLKREKQPWNTCRIC